MNTIYLIKEIYSQSFNTISNMVVKNYMKIFAWFGFSMYGIVLYAFLFRISTGFAFD